MVSHDMEDHAKKCVERCCELANMKTKQLYKVLSPCLGDHHFKRVEMETVGELSKVCSQICPEMFVIGTNWKARRHSMVSEPHLLEQSQKG